VTATLCDTIIRQSRGRDVSHKNKEELLNKAIKSAVIRTVNIENIIPVKIVVCVRYH